MCRNFLMCISNTRLCFGQGLTAYTRDVLNVFRASQLTLMSSILNLITTLYNSLCIARYHKINNQPPATHLVQVGTHGLTYSYYIMSFFVCLQKNLS